MTQGGTSTSAGGGQQVTGSYHSHSRLHTECVCVEGEIIQLGWLTTGGPRGAQDQAFPQTERLIPGQA